MKAATLSIDKIIGAYANCRLNKEDFFFFEFQSVRFRMPFVLAAKNIRAMTLLLRPGSWNIRAAVVDRQLVLMDGQFWAHTIPLVGYSEGLSCTY